MCVCVQKSVISHTHKSAHSTSCFFTSIHVAGVNNKFASVPFVPAYVCIISACFLFVFKHECIECIIQVNLALLSAYSQTTFAWLFGSTEYYNSAYILTPALWSINPSFVLWCKSVLLLAHVTMVVLFKHVFVASAQAYDRGAPAPTLFNLIQHTGKYLYISEYTGAFYMLPAPADFERNSASHVWSSQCTCVRAYESTTAQVYCVIGVFVWCISGTAVHLGKNKVGGMGACSINVWSAVLLRIWYMHKVHITLFCCYATMVILKYELDRLSIVPVLSLTVPHFGNPLCILQFLGAFHMLKALNVFECAFVHCVWPNECVCSRDRDLSTTHSTGIAGDRVRSIRSIFYNPCIYLFTYVAIDLLPYACTWFSHTVCRRLVHCACAQTVLDASKAILPLSVWHDSVAYLCVYRYSMYTIVLGGQASRKTDCVRCSSVHTCSSILPRIDRPLCITKYIGAMQMASAFNVIKRVYANIERTCEREPVRLAWVHLTFLPSGVTDNCLSVAVAASMHAMLWPNIFVSCYFHVIVMLNVFSSVLIFIHRSVWRSNFPRFFEITAAIQVVMNINSEDGHCNLTPEILSLSVVKFVPPSATISLGETGIGPAAPSSSLSSGVVGGTGPVLLEPAPMDSENPDVVVGGLSLEAMKPSTSEGTTVPSSRPKSGLTRSERREFFKRGAKKVPVAGAPESSKRQRSDDSTTAPKTKRSTASVKPLTSPDLEVVISDKSVENGALTIIETIRFELSSMLLSQDPSEFGPEFQFAGSAGGWLDLRCKNVESKNWLVDKIAVLNGRLEGKSVLTVRARSEMRTYRVSALPRSSHGRIKFCDWTSAPPKQKPAH